MAGTIDSFSYCKKLSYVKYFLCSCHATWLPCKTSIDQAYSVKWLDIGQVFFAEKNEANI